MFPRAFLRTLVSTFFVFSCFFLGASSAFADTYELTGWAWGSDNNASQGQCGGALPPCAAEGVGWISFNSKTEGSSQDYKVTVDSVTGDFNGYAWSPNIGWITFSSIAMQKCSSNSGDTCPPGPPPVANVNLSASGQIPVTGWARACAVFVSGCSGALRPDSQRGGWDGWIRLGGAGYGWKVDVDLATMSMKFLSPSACPTCYAWGGNGGNSAPPTWLVVGHESPIGWLMTKDLVINTTVPPAPPTLTFVADQDTLCIGQSTTLRWLTGGNITSCTASGGWSGPKASAPGVWHSQVIAPPVTANYNLQCTGPDGQTPLRSLPITVNNCDSVPINGACGSAHGKGSKIKPTANLCSAGNLLDPPGVVDDGSNTWVWTCAGINGGSDTVPPFCSAPRTKFFRIKIF